MCFWAIFLAYKNLFEKLWLWGNFLFVELL